MAWNKSLPADATKLRLSAAIIRSNWDAIETGGVPYTKLQLAKQAVDPTRQNSTGWVYGKDPGSGFTELYYEDDRNASLKTRLTNAGGIGALGQLIYGSAVITSGTYQNTQDAFCSAWARVNSNGSLIAGYKVSGSTRDAAGEYTITFSPAFSNTTYCVVGMCRDTSDPDHNRDIMVTDTTTTTISVRTQRNSSDDEDVSFYIAVFGGR